MSAPVVCNDSGKEKAAKTLTNLRGFLVRSRELESLALWLKEPTGQNTLILEVSSFRYFCAKHRDFSLRNFCVLCRILQVRVPIASLETVQKQCRNRALILGQMKNDDFWSMTWWRFEWPQRYIWYIGRIMPTCLRSSQGSGHFCIMAFCICHLPILAWRLPFFEMKLTLLA